MQKKVMSFMEEYHMAEEGDCILAAVSGGADSLCLLLILLALKEKRNYRLCAVHVEHGIRGKDSQEDALFVEKFCKKNKVPCKVYHCQAADYAREHKMTVEEGARALRYGFFAQAAEAFGADKIAVAHNKNDCAETMLFHLVRGTGLKGLCGILPVRGNIIRPLLCLERNEIEAYLKKRGQEFRTDKTNEELEYTRNRIRHQVLPILEEINSQAVAHMNQTAFLAAEAAELLEDLAEQAREKHVRRDDRGIHIPQAILTEKPAVQKALLHRVLTESAGSSRDISGVHIQQMQELFERQVGRILHLPYGMEAERTYDGLLLKKEKTKTPGESCKERKPSQTCEKPLYNGAMTDKKTESCESWTLPADGVLEIPSFGYEIHTRLLEKIPQNEEIPKKMYTKWLDYDKIKGNMQLRTRKEKDFFVIDPEGRRKKLKNYLIDEKVPKQERDHILLFVDDVHIVWAIGYRISEDVKVTEHTKRILEIQVCGGMIHE